MKKREIVLKMRVFAQHQLMYKADFVLIVDVVKVLHPRMKIKGDGQVISQSFIVNRPGTVLLTFDNSTKKKALLVYKCCRKTVQI
ncbi:unnamed protein product [Arabis nemorensis]|uniref:Uncharacterized protein n=1 Tax=Arabis nemorensis TaxID=586526 RepID=A0A565B7C2_9BRAS|nr:unnamed protein product [Arabis nemorensis]